MPVYFIVAVQCPGDRGDYAEYIEQVRPIVESHGGVYLVRTENIRSFTPDWKPDRVIVIRFDSQEALDTCFSSPEYQAIMRMREDNVKAGAIIVEGLQ